MRLPVSLPPTREALELPILSAQTLVLELHNQLAKVEVREPHQAVVPEVCAHCRTDCFGDLLLPLRCWSQKLHRDAAREIAERPAHQPDHQRKPDPQKERHIHGLASIRKALSAGMGK